MTAENSTTAEVWKDIPRLPGHQISDRGRIRSFWKRVCSNLGATRHLVDQPRILKPILSARGYLTIRALDTEGVHRTCQIHRLVLESFVGSCPENHEGCHKDGDRTHNYIDNLYWGTRQQNCLDTQRHGRNPNSILTPEKVQEVVRLHNDGWTQQAIADRFGMAQASIAAFLIRHGYRTMRKRFTKEEIDRIAEMRRNGASMRTVAEQFDSTPKGIDSVLRRVFGSSRLK